MAITPMDIHNKEFSKSFMGFKPDEVDQFLDEVVEDYERLYKDNIELKNKITMLTEQISQFKAMEETLKETLVTAQKTAEEVIANAQKKSELIISQAEEHARKIVEKANNEVVDLQNESFNIKKQVQVYKTKFKMLMESQLELLNDSDFDNI